MAFDALRLRNIIQLIGILSEHRSHIVLSLTTERYNLILVFHAALIVMAALQVHQTRTAIVQQEGCDATVNFVVSCRFLSDAKRHD
jgi:hypothetical protein